MTEATPDQSSLIKLLTLPLAEFAEVTHGLNPKLCPPGFEPEAFLLHEARLHHVPVSALQDWLKREYMDGARVFDGWVRLALEYVKNDMQQVNNRP